MAMTYKPNQIYRIVNSLVNMGIGKEKIKAVDTASLVSLGADILSTATDKEAFLNSLSDVLSQTIVDVEEYAPNKRAFYMQTHDFGNALRIITYEFGESSIDRGWAGINAREDGSRGEQMSPFTNTPNTTATEHIYKGFNAWEYDDCITDLTLNTAFENADAMATFISGWYLTKQNKLKFDVEVVGNGVVSHAMYTCYEVANKVSGAVTSLCENVLDYYNRDILGLECTYNNGIVYPNGWVTKTNALKDKGFLRYLSQFISQRISHFRDMTTAFNPEKHTTQCKNPVLEVNSFVASACKYWSESDTYHNDLVSLPNYNEVSYWLASGNYDFEDTSSIMTDDSGDIKMDSICAFLYDPKAIMMTVENYRSHSIYNPKDEVINTFDKANLMHAIAMFKNMCVIQIADPTYDTVGEKFDYHRHGYAYEVE